MPDGTIASRLRAEYFNSGLQYYVAARYAASAGLAPLAGNLFHHAMERFLKGALCNKTTREERKTLGHNLKKLWKKLKDENPGRSLRKFDAIVSSLHKFEKIRYPEDRVLKGMACTLQFGQSFKAITKGHSVPNYVVAVGEIDRLVKEIFDASNINPRFFSTGYNKHARLYLRRMNRSNKTKLW